MARVEVYFRTKWRLHRSSHLATIDISRKLGAVALLEGSWVEAYLRTMWHRDLFSRLATIDMGHKLWGCSLFGEGAGSPSSTMRPGPRPTYILRGIVIHPAVWQQLKWAENWGCCAPLGEGELGPHLIQCGRGRGLPACQVSS